MGCVIEVVGGSGEWWVVVVGCWVMVVVVVALTAYVGIDWLTALLAVEVHIAVQCNPAHWAHKWLALVANNQMPT